MNLEFGFRRLKYGTPYETHKFYTVISKLGLLCPHMSRLVQAAGVVEYTDCIYAKG